MQEKTDLCRKVLGVGTSRILSIQKDIREEKQKKTRACIEMAKKAAEQMFTKASASSLHVSTDAVETYTSWRWCNASTPDTPATTSAAPVASLEMVQRQYARYTCNNFGRTSSVTGDGATPVCQIHLQQLRPHQ